ncbi:hypothetical protein Goe21_00360 [Bacillus phage vB_BsuM-Goe21]|nr:hypothetical protein Goe21_00360 [Bacillus phage vB_BsuM-Goe21]
MIKDFEEYYQELYRNVHLILRNNKYYIDSNKTQFDQKCIDVFNSLNEAKYLFQENNRNYIDYKFFKRLLIDGYMENNKTKEFFLLCVIILNKIDNLLPVTQSVILPKMLTILEKLDEEYGSDIYIFIMTKLKETFIKISSNIINKDFIYKQIQDYPMSAKFIYSKPVELELDLDLERPDIDLMTFKHNRSNIFLPTSNIFKMLEMDYILYCNDLELNNKDKMDYYFEILYNDYLKRRNLFPFDKITFKNPKYYKKLMPTTGLYDGWSFIRLFDNIGIEDQIHSYFFNAVLNIVKPTTIPKNYDYFSFKYKELFNKIILFNLSLYKEQDKKCNVFKIEKYLSNEYFSNFIWYDIFSEYYERDHMDSVKRIREYRATSLLDSL